MTFDEYLAELQKERLPLDYKAPSVYAYNRGILPHLTYHGGIFFITTRLADSMPEEIVRQWRKELGIIEEKISDEVSLEALRELISRIEDYEDAGHGKCYLRYTRVAQMVSDALHFYSGKDYSLLAWSVMPNHMHMLIRLLGVDYASQGPHVTLGKIMRKIKSYTARQAREILDISGEEPFWQADYYDRYIRNRAHLINSVKYILNNPRKIGYDTRYTGTIFDDLRRTMKQ